MTPPVTPTAPARIPQFDLTRQYREIEPEIEAQPTRPLIATKRS